MKRKKTGASKRRPARPADNFLHPQQPAEAPWKLLPAFLLAAFAVRAAIALSGDFVIHPDEVMQYLEPARRLVFDSGLVFWEYFYGARSWLVPGVVAGVLYICKALGLGEPAYYIAAVKLFFCFISIAIPWCMYAFCRRHWSEKTARTALVLGVFWYELAGFAHKPMTEFIATALLMWLLVVAAPFAAAASSRRRWLLAGALGGLIVAVRFQYAPAAGLILLVAFWRCGKTARTAIIGGGAGVLAAVALLEAQIWGLDDALFHSYYVNIKMNLIVGAGRAGESSVLHMPFWLLLASGGLILAAVFGVFDNFRRRGFIAALMLLILLPHMLQNHREYRFIFAVIPLWLMLFADFIATRPGGAATARKILGAGFAGAGVVAFLGILNQIPFQEKIYVGFSRGTDKAPFILNQDPIFKIYRALAADKSVRGAVDFTRAYFNTGGYYYFGHDAPFYDQYSWDLVEDGGAVSDYASHIITNTTADGGGKVVSSVRGDKIVSGVETAQGMVALPAFVYDGVQKELIYWDKLQERHPQPDYEIAGQFGGLILWKIKTPQPVRKWRRHVVVQGRVVPDYNFERKMMREILGDNAPTPPENLGIEFIDE